MTNQEAREIISNIDKAYRNFTKTEIQALEMAINALKQEPILDQIKADVKKNFNDRPSCYNHPQRTKFYVEVLQIIDKHKAESEDGKNDILDEIRAEIMNLTDGEKPERVWNVDVLLIIDKYRAE